MTLPLPRSCGNSSFDQIDRDGETDAHIAAGTAKNRGIDADHFAAQIDQRPAGITGIDRGVGLNKISYGPWPICRPLALTIPDVTVLSKPKGLPMATTHSPTSRLIGIAQLRRP